MTIWFTGCQHFNHKRIIKLANRPFDTVHQMNKAIIDNWNSVVESGDTVYVMGDICWPNNKDDIGDPTPWLDQLIGNKIIIWGNHDDQEYIPSTDVVKRCHEYLEITIQGQRLVLFHYPIEDWNRRWRGSIHLHAHDHLPEFRNPAIPRVIESGLDLGPASNMPENMVCNRFRVGVDACEFTPVSFDMIMGAAYGPKQ